MADPVNFIAQWLKSYLESLGLASGWISVIMAALGVVVLASAVLLVDIFLVWVERKVVARFQDRLGPNRLGPFGLFQPIADVIKLLIKEDITPQGADKFVYNLAPILALATVIMLWAVIPISATVAGSSINVGALYIVAVGAIGTLGIIMAGWASNNKYALLGAFRMVAQMISYEVPMVIAILIPVILAKSMTLTDIVESQTVWYIVLAPIAAIVFLIGAQAELGRAPFDLSEAESEIVAGFHIEYTGMKFGLFYAGELLHA
ncbi:MAG: NADH-quinone oxidoreductase subunit H, partial [Anaerolineales bacterium]|nr:NADH-quinone oxidoreductase subunit H [Anaerolineales bacterium]